MKNLELKNVGVQGLDTTKLKSVDGGLFYSFNWGTFWRGFAIGGTAGVAGSSLALSQMEL